MNTRSYGNAGEEAACAYLKQHLWKIVARNVRRGGNEIDIIARRFGLTAFIEVKRRASDAYGSPAEAVNISKQRRIIRAAMLYIQENNLEDSDVRFDVIEVTPSGIHHIENAFDATEPY